MGDDMSEVVDIELMQKKVTALQNALLEMPQAEIITTHKFLPGVYERTICIPPWTVLTGAAHKTDYHVRVDKGTIAVNTEDGVKVVTGPCDFPAKAGMQRAGRVFADEVVWTDIYENPDNCTDIATLEDRLYVVPECGLGENRQLALKNETSKITGFLGTFDMPQPATNDAEVKLLVEN
jgi:hypothetical protein